MYVTAACKLLEFDQGISNKLDQKSLIVMCAVLIAFAREPLLKGKAQYN
jgi:hypothetical protein